VPRKSTLVGIGAQRPSGEYAPTLPAPADPPLKKTWRLPTPPSAVALARRTDPPPPVDTLPAPGAAAGRPGGSLPPVSGDPDETVREALRRRAEAAEAKIAAAEARAQEAERRHRVQLESQGPGPYQSPVIVAQERPSKAPESGAGEGSTKALRSALTKLLLGLAALLALLGVPLTAYIQALTTKIERSTAQAAQANARADAVEAKAETKIKDAATSEREFRQLRSNLRELMRLQGVEIPKREGDPDPEDLKPYAPLCSAGKVCPGPQLILTRPL
jgi:hypothetical protein